MEPENSRPSVPPNGKCPQKDGRENCPLVCKYNQFESEDLSIDAWELKCLDCGWRDTVGYRSDEIDEDDIADGLNTKQCPFCKKTDLKPGQEPCQNSSENCT